MSEITPRLPLLKLAAQIVAAHATHNPLTSDELPRLIESLYGALAGRRIPVALEATQQPAVPVKRSVFPSHIVCLEDGKKLIMLKRHLSTTFGLTPEQYRRKWRLPTDYPMVAPDYAARRSTLAKQFEFGRRPAATHLEPGRPATRGRPRRGTA